MYSDLNREPGISSHSRVFTSTYDKIGVIAADLKIGDEVLTFDFVTNRCKSTTIIGIMKTYVTNGIIHRYINKHVYITSNHPIFEFNTSKWYMPSYHTKFSRGFRHNGWMYSFLLEDGSNIIVDGIPVITLGHNILYDECASHSFFGSKEIMLNFFTLYAVDGIVDITDFTIIRNENDSDNSNIDNINGIIDEFNESYIIDIVPPIPLSK